MCAGSVLSSWHRRGREIVGAFAGCTLSSGVYDMYGDRPVVHVAAAAMPKTARCEKKANNARNSNDGSPTDTAAAAAAQTIGSHATETTHEMQRNITDTIIAVLSDGQPLTFRSSDAEEQRAIELLYACYPRVATECMCFMCGDADAYVKWFLESVVVERRRRVVRSDLPANVQNIVRDVVEQCVRTQRCDAASVESAATRGDVAYAHVCETCAVVRDASGTTPRDRLLLSRMHLSAFALPAKCTVLGPVLFGECFDRMVAWSADPSNAAKIKACASEAHADAMRDAAWKRIAADVCGVSYENAYTKHPLFDFMFDLYVWTTRL